MESIQVQISQPGRDVWQELAKLQQVTPHFSYRADPVNPGIVHIVDARLAGQKGYALENVLRSLDFTGTVRDLINALAKQGIGVSSQGVFDYYEGATIDFKTRVHVKGKHFSVRTALSDFIPLERRGGRIILDCQDKTW